MSASPFTSPGTRTMAAPVRRRDDVRRRATTLLVGGLLASAAACSADANGVDVTPVATATTPPTVEPSPLNEQAALLEQYQKFWATLTPVSRMPAEQRGAALAKVAVDPALQSLIAGMAATEANGQAFYGAHVPRATQASLSADGLTAVIDDCQDSSKTGLVRLSDSTPVTVGAIRNHVVVTLKKSGGMWKVSFVDYAKSPC